MKAQNEIGNVKGTKSLLNLSKHRIWVVLGKVAKLIYGLVIALLRFALRTVWLVVAITIRTAFMVILGTVLSLVIKIAGVAFIFWLIIF